MRVAIVHDWLYTYAGAEHVLEQIISLYPEAELFSLFDFLPDDLRFFIHDKPVQTSFIQHLPFVRSKHRQYLPLMPLAIEQFNLSNYDLVISSSYAVAKGVLTGPDQLHICMCYSPARYIWDLYHQYLNEAGLDHGIRGFIAKCSLHYVRLWDYRTAASVDSFVAISNYIARRIWKYYRRKAIVIYPPVDVDVFFLHEAKEDFYLTASRMVPYKKMDIIVEAFAGMPDRRLVVIGDGPDFKKIQAKSAQNIELLSQQDQGNLRDYMQRARAFVFAAEEDFGIIPLEAQACGTPVIAYGRGGVCETIRALPNDQPTGVFFEEQSIDAIQQAVARFEDNLERFLPQNCRENVMRFSPDRFRREFADYVRREWIEFNKM